MNVPQSSKTTSDLSQLKVVNMHEAKTYLSSLVGEAVAGRPFIIAKAGTPQAIVYSYQSLVQPSARVGFMPDIEIIGEFSELDEQITGQFSESEIFPNGRLDSDTA